MKNTFDHSINVPTGVDHHLQVKHTCETHRKDMNKNIWVCIEKNWKVPTAPLESAMKLKTAFYRETGRHPCLFLNINKMLCKLQNTGIIIHRETHAFIFYLFAGVLYKT